MGSSVRLGAIFTLFATKFKREYGDVTIGVSPEIASAPNFSLISFTTKENARDCAG